MNYSITLEEELLVGEKYSALSNGAKFAYCLLKQALKESLHRNWVDETKRMFLEMEIFFSELFGTITAGELSELEEHSFIHIIGNRVYLSEE
jgi:hypothetical protein